jgi:serine/threonine protein kinase
MFCTYCRAPNPEDAAFCSACGRDITTSSGKNSNSGPLESEPTDLGLVIGSLLSQRYRIQKTIGVGGMGRVYLGEDEKLKMPVAIKVMREILSRDPGSVARLMAEARHAMQLAHTNIIRVHNFEDDGIVKFLVMEYVEGETLAHRVASQSRLSEAETRQIGIAICHGLEHAHEKRVIHRDLKPANVLLGKDGSIKIADFGIARACRDSVSRLTSQKDDSGTLPYMSPEQMMGESSEASDIYSLGAVLYELLSGEPPFHTGDIWVQIREKPPKPLAGVSSELDAVVRRCLEKNPEARFAHVSDLEEALSRRPAPADAQSSRAIDSGSLPVSQTRAVEPILPSEKTENAKVASKTPIRRSFRWLAWGVTVVLAVGLLVMAGILYPHLKSGYVAQKDIPAFTDAKEPSASVPGTLWRSPIDGRPMAWVPPGSFWMGSWAAVLKSAELEVIPHSVRIEKGFWMDTTEVTYEAYRRFVLANPEWQKDRIDGKYHDGHYLEDWNGNEYRDGLDNYPVIFVSWYAARAYAQWAGKRLPSEAEWEYACRAGTTTVFWWGDSFDPGRANVNNKGSIPAAEPHKNPWGLYDMTGNLWEMTSSLANPYPYRSDDGREDPGATGVRASRGGGWESVEEALWSGYRGMIAATTCDNSQGFRCAR